MTRPAPIIETCRCGARFEFEPRKARSYELQDAADQAFLTEFRDAHAPCRSPLTFAKFMGLDTEAAVEAAREGG